MNDEPKVGGHRVFGGLTERDTEFGGFQESERQAIARSEKEKLQAKEPVVTVEELDALADAQFAADMRTMAETGPEEDELELFRKTLWVCLGMAIAHGISTMEAEIRRALERKPGAHQ